MTTIKDINEGNLTTYRIDPDNYPVENSLLRGYAKGIASGSSLPYPSIGSTALCYLGFCGNFVNSNTMADQRLQRNGISPPNTETANVPGGVFDSEKTPLAPLQNTAIGVLDRIKNTLP